MDVKAAINRKKSAFVSSDQDMIKIVQRDMKRAIRQGKREYKEKMEGRCQ